MLILRVVLNDTYLAKKLATIASFFWKFGFAKITRIFPKPFVGKCLEIWTCYLIWQFLAKLENPNFRNFLFWQLFTVSLKAALKTTITVDHS